MEVNDYLLSSYIKRTNLNTTLQFSDMENVPNILEDAANKINALVKRTDKFLLKDEKAGVGFHEILHKALTFSQK